MAVQETETGAAVLEIDRFEFAGDRIELEGTWSGLRGRRFIRPTLVLRGESGEDLRLLALLEHKPWAADDGEAWIAAFRWDGEPAKFQSSELNVASGIDLKLPAPRMRPGKPRRFKPRIVSFDATRTGKQQGPSPKNPGIVTEELSPKAPEATQPMPAASAAPAAPEVANAPKADAQTAPKADAPDGRLESLRKELDIARTERDKARDQVRALRGELEQERQARERAIADARAEERESATTMLSEGANLRAAVERQREMAYSARDEAIAARDKAIEARDAACAERDQAIAARREAERARTAADHERDQAHKERDRAFAERDKALEERSAATSERDAAFEERDTIVNLHERGLPIKQPQPRFAPGGHEPQSDLEVWMPRGIAIGILVIFAFIVLRLFAG